MTPDPPNRPYGFQNPIPTSHGAPLMQSATLTMPPPLPYHEMRCMTFAVYMETGATDDACLVWSNEHRRWWNVEGQGYTADLARAGVYDRTDALRICCQAINGWNPEKPLTEIPVAALDMVRVALGHPRLFERLGQPLVSPMLHHAG